MRITRSEPELPQVWRGEPITVSLDGRPTPAFAGETVAALLLAQGIRTFRRTAKAHQPRGMFCGIGICYDCLVTIDGIPNIRACLTPLVPGMTIETSAG